MLPFDLSLGASQPGRELFDRTTRGDASLSKLCRRFRPIRSCQHVVVEGHELPVRTSVTLPGAAADQLPVDACGIVKLGADDVQTAQFFDVAVQLNIGSAASHVGRHNHFPPLAGLTHDRGLCRVAVGVEDVVFNSRVGQQRREGQERAGQQRLFARAS